MAQPQHQPQRSRTPVLFYIPNILGYIRILLAFVGLYYSILQQPIIAIIIWILASVLDLLDGKIARWLQQTSQFGILLDIVADNILRTIIYIATCNAATVAYYVSALTASIRGEAQPNLIGHSIVSSHFSTIVIIIIACFIICIEWITMISTQLYTVYHATAHDTASTHTSSRSKTGEDSSHWKKLVTNPSTVTTTATDRPEEWWMVQYYFSNNFCNPMGILGIYGLFASNLFLYGCYYPHVYQSIPYYNLWMYLAFVGRLLSLVIEFKFCGQFIHYMVSREEQKIN